MKKKMTVVLMCVMVLAAAVLFFPKKSEAGNGVSTQAYHELEKEYVQSLRSVLEEQGMEHAGITMTKTYREDGSRAYDVLIHHRAIQRMDESEQRDLQKLFREISFPVEGCTFFCHFYEAE